jgi:hypothetical protein
LGGKSARRIVNGSGLIRFGSIMCAGCCLANLQKRFPGSIGIRRFGKYDQAFDSAGAFSGSAKPPSQDLFEGEEISKIIFDFIATNPGRFVSDEELRAHVWSQLMASIPPEGSA